MPGDSLSAVIDRIVPRDGDPGALDLGTPDFVRAMLERDDRLATEVTAGLAALPPGFADAAPEAQDAALQDRADEPWFTALVELTQEGFWANPGNGGNRGARSWAMIGYRYGLPDGPDGPGRT